MSRKIIIYGGASGIGLATGKQLKEKGYALHLVGRNEDALASAADDLGAGYTVGDVKDPELFPRVAEDAGKSVHGLVYAVGTINLGAFQRFKEADYLKDFQVNAVGAALAVQSALPALKNSFGTASVVLF